MKKYIKQIILIMLAVIILLSGLKAWQIGSIGYALYGHYQQAQEMANNPTKADLSQIQPLIHQTHLDLAALQQALQPFNGLLHRLDWLPRIGGDIAATPDLLAMAVPLTEIGDVCITAIDPVLQQLATRTAQPITAQEILSTLTLALAENKPHFQTLQQPLNQAIHHRANINLATLSPRVAQQLTRFDKGLPILQLGLDFLPLAPDLLGATTPRTYLILAQNNDELRATGGFISSVGLLTLDKGNIAALTFEDSYAIDDFTIPHPEAPAPMLRYMSAYVWAFRDGNWSPDFPTAAQDLLDLYHINRDTPIDGLIASDQIALQEIVKAIQPIKVPNWDEAATGKNVISLIRQSWSPDSEVDNALKEKGWWKNRKNFVSDLITAMRSKIEDTPQDVDWPNLTQAIFKILNERNVQIWLEDDATQAFIEARGWHGAIPPITQDYLGLVDTNFGFNKVNAVATTVFSYHVQLESPQSAQAILTVTHKNNSKGQTECNHKPHYGGDYAASINRCYWNYLRIYTPQQTKLLLATPHTIPAKFLLTQRDEPARVITLPSEVNKTVWGTLLLIPRKQSRTTTFYYTLPPTVLQKTEHGQRYHLHLHKQSGTRGHKAQIIIQLPPHSELIETTPADVEVDNEGRLIFNLQLNTDQEIEVIFKVTG